MRPKTLVLGALATIILALMSSSGREIPEVADRGFNPGEMLPSIEVKDAIVVVWSKDDAVSRLVNSWASHHFMQSDYELISLCIDANQEETELLSQWDKVDNSMSVIGFDEGEAERRRMSRDLAVKGQGKIFFTQNGVIQEVYTAEEVWQRIQNSKV